MTSKFERQYNGRAMREVKRLIDLGRSEPIIPEPENLYAYDHKPGQTKWTAIWLSVVFLLCLFAGCEKHAFAYSDEQAIKVLVGESADQGFKGMVCVGEVLRHHSSLNGFYGLHASHSTKEAPWVWRRAKKAWLASAHTNYTHGANHFENIHAFGCPYWVKNCVKTFAWKDHVFYKEFA